MQIKQYDIAVVGGGMVGALFAALAAKRGFRVAVLEAVAPAPFEPDSPLDLRVSAFSQGSERLLVQAGAWSLLERWRLCPYRHMRVFDETHRYQTHFDSAELAEPQLGHIIENRLVQLSLLHALSELDGVDYFCPCRLTQLESSLDHVTLHTDQNLRLQARLVVAADGPRSAVRQRVGIGVDRYDYQQSALVVSVRTAYPQSDTTWQRFMPDGPQAFLPLAGPHASLVWYHQPEEVTRLAALAPEVLLDEIRQAFPPNLGEIASIEQVGSFPIIRQHAKRYVTGRVVLMGDAAHAIHPLAGQGVNQGFLDAAYLARCLGRAQRGFDPGARRLLRVYERRRRCENTDMIAILEAFHHAFTAPAPLRQLAGLGLGVAGAAPSLQRQVMRYAMGDDPVTYPPSPADESR